ncbi:hypothetical protein HFO88_26285 [Rhizobium leguminosarum]|uniref:hypothetical protein n=1 Tax=Rhizobium leguminosarum TaxID=384 RepID=UPI001C963638|nr:hypothetical protein [Rhizobium leguminosarum]MBY5903829.1 hypothetical protein [Rhizobium leguminosarum]MBY5911074.1 hypothetical protein [Rhizobium leguminosarum]
MALPERLGYRFDSRRLCMATSALALIFLLLRIIIMDSLTLGYTMSTPVYVVLSAVIEGARLEKSSLRDGRAWAETIVAITAAMAVGYLGYRLWLLGY